MMQIRPPGGGLAYAPYRDITHFFAPLVRAAIVELPEGLRNYLIKDFLDYTQTSDEDLVKACEGFVGYMGRCTEPDDKSAVESLERGGFLDTKAAAQFALLAKIGEKVAATYWWAVRESQIARTQPANKKELDAALKQAAHAILNPDAAPPQEAV